MFYFWWGCRGNFLSLLAHKNKSSPGQAQYKDIRPTCTHLFLVRSSHYQHCSYFSGDLSSSHCLKVVQPLTPMVLLHLQLRQPELSQVHHSQFHTTLCACFSCSVSLQQSLEAQRPLKHWVQQEWSSGLPCLQKHCPRLNVYCISQQNRHSRLMNPSQNCCCLMLTFHHRA